MQRHRSRQRSWLGSLTTAAIIAGLGCVAALASPINIDTGKTLVVAPGSSGTLTLSLTNQNAGSTITDFNGWSTGLQLLPQAGAIGTATITSAALPATNAALTDPEIPLTFNPNQTLLTPANGTSLYSFLISSNQSPAVTTFALGQQYNVADLTVTLSPNAAGTWNLFAVNNANGIAGWANPSGTVTDYGNLARANGDAGTRLIGTVSAVPEPEGLVASAAVMAAAWFAWRSRRLRTVATVCGA